jgi:hemolysin type calcium-binding protein
MHVSRLGLGAAIAAALVSLMALAASAAASTKWADLRVVTHTGRTLAEFRQYTGSTTVRSSTKGDCFGSPSSGKRYKLDDPNALGIIQDALASDRALRPLVLSDAFVDDGFGLGVCAIGGFTVVGSSYWDLVVNHVTSSTGASLTPARNGDQILWYFTSGKEPISGPRELVLNAPAQANPGKPFTVKATRYTSAGKSSPAGGVTITADGRSVGKTGSDGELTATLPDSATLQADGTANDIPSNHVGVCVGSSKCPGAHGKMIYGSEHADRIKGTRGPDRIAARGGSDVVNLRSGGEDRVNCGGGRDEVIVDPGDRNDHIGSSCERVKRR